MKNEMMTIRHSPCVYDVYTIVTLLTYKYRTGSILNWIVALHAAVGASDVKTQTWLVFLIRPQTALMICTTHVYHAELISTILMVRPMLIANYAYHDKYLWSKTIRELFVIGWVTSPFSRLGRKHPNVLNSFFVINGGKKPETNWTDFFQSSNTYWSSLHER